MALRSSKLFLGIGVSAVALSACADAKKSTSVLPPASFNQTQQTPSEQYLIGPFDELNIIVWNNPALGGKVPVRPDGRITTPLVADMPAVDKTTAMLAADIRLALTKYIDNPQVQVIVSNFSGTFSQQVRIVGGEKPASIPFRANMTLLDAMILVGGLGQFAAGNNAKLVRVDKESGTQKTYKLKINDLLKRGDSRANVQLQPGDVIIIPESMF